MSYLASATDWLNAWGPIAWGVMFFMGAYLALGLRFVWSAIKSRNFINRQVEIAVSTDGVNPRQVRFERQKIPLVDFYSPYYFRQVRKHFIDCDLFGPVLLHMYGGTITGVELRQCQIVIARDDARVWGATVLEYPTIFGGTMANVTLLMNRTQYLGLDQEIRENVPVIHDIERI